VEIRIKWFVTDMPFLEAAMSVAEYDIFQLALKYQTFIPGYTAEDIAQELRFELWKKLPKYNPTGTASLRTWTLVVLRYKIYRLRRDSKRYKRVVHHSTCPFEDERNETGCIISDELHEQT